MKIFGLVMAALALCAVVSPAQQTFEPPHLPDSIKDGRPPFHPTLAWFAVQLVPSPEWSPVSGDGARFGLRWQLTPALYSFGVNRHVSPWRVFVADPFARQSGSIELFVSPEYLNITEMNEGRWALRTGFRGYVPLWQRGEYLSASAAASYFIMGNINGVGYEGGLYILAGIFGAQATYTPRLAGAAWTFTFQFRYF